MVVHRFLNSTDYLHLILGTSKNRFFASFVQSLRPLRLTWFGFNRKVRNGLCKGGKVQIGCVSSPLTSFSFYRDFLFFGFAHRFDKSTPPTKRLTHAIFSPSARSHPQPTNTISNNKTPQLHSTQKAKPSCRRTWKMRTIFTHLLQRPLTTMQESC